MLKRVDGGRNNGREDQTDQKSLECCRADENGNLEHCGECPYDAVSICVDECRTAMNLDIYAVMDEAGLFDGI